MSAAHELVERGFNVEIYEKQSRYVGGKARSVDVPGPTKPGNKQLPGKHGFIYGTRIGTWKINISHNTYTKIKEYFHCHHKGKIKAKNNGSINM